MANVSSLLSILSGSLAPITAVLAVYIAYQQYRTNRLKLRSELYQRRLAVYEALFQIAERVWQSDKEGLLDVGELVAKVSEAEFLFGADVKGKVEEALAQLDRLRVLNWSSKDPHLRQAAREDALSQSQQVRRYFWQLRKDLPKLFAPYLSLGRIR